MSISPRRGVVGLAIVAALATTAACTDPATPPITTSAPTTAVPTSTTSTTTPADPQLAGAEAAVAKLWGLVDELGTDSKRRLDELTTVSRGQSLDTWRELLAQRRRQGHRQIGTTSIVSLEASSSEGKLTVDTCIDVSKVSLVDKDGKSVVAANRAPRVRYSSVVELATDGKYYVTKDKAVETC